MKLKYKAIKKEGDVYEMTVEISSKDELFKRLRDRGEKIVSVSLVGNGENVFMDLFESFFNKVKTEELIIFSRNLGSMIEAGLSISRSIAVMLRQIKNEKFKKILFKLDESVEKGEPLSVAMGYFPNVFSPLFVHMVQAGEESGSMVNSLHVISDQMENSYTLRKKIKGALIYPAIVFIVMFIIGVLMLIYVVPSLTATFKEFELDLPASTQFLIFISDLLTNHYIIFILFIVTVTVLSAVFLRTKTGKTFSSFVVLRLPIIGDMAKETNSALASRTLASLLVAGVDFVKSLEITRGVISNLYYKEVLEKAEKNIQKGSPLSVIFEERPDLFPPLVPEMLKVGEETGKMPEMLLKLADFYEKEISQKTKDISTIIEPVLMIVVGFLVGFFAFSIISPMYSLMSGV